LPGKREDRNNPLKKEQCCRIICGSIVPALFVYAVLLQKKRDAARLKILGSYAAGKQKNDFHTVLQIAVKL